MVLCIHQRQMTDTTRVNIQALVHNPEPSNKYPKMIGHTKPPRPPRTPTIPPTTPTSSGKYSGMCLYTAALPIPQILPNITTKKVNTQTLAWKKIFVSPLASNSLFSTLCPTCTTGSCQVSFLGNTKSPSAVSKFDSFLAITGYLMPAAMIFVSLTSVTSPACLAIIPFPGE